MAEIFDRKTEHMPDPTGAASAQSWQKRWIPVILALGLLSAFILSAVLFRGNAGVSNSGVNQGGASKTSGGVVTKDQAPFPQER